MKYTTVISSGGSPIDSIESDTLEGIIELTDSFGKLLYEEGNRNLEVTFENYPEEDLDLILNIYFAWEWL